MHEQADPPHPLGLLRARPERPRNCCTAEQRDYVAASHASPKAQSALNPSQSIAPALPVRASDPSFTACFSPPVGRGLWPPGCLDCSDAHSTSATGRYCRKRILWVFPRNIDSREGPYSQHRFNALSGSILLLRFGMAPRTFSTPSRPNSGRSLFSAPCHNQNSRLLSRGTGIGIALVSPRGHAMKLPHRRNFLRLAAGAATLPAASRAAWAQSYPSRPVRWIVGFAP